jgi:hypothetical protein
MKHPSLHAILLASTVAACNPSNPSSDEAETTTSSPTDDASESDSTSTSTSTTTATMSTSSSDDADFVVEPDMPPEPCSAYMQDCPEGEKCVFYGESTFMWTKCVPILGDKQPGEDCTWDGIEAATDDCALGSFCVDLDWEDGDPSGECRAFCSATDPACEPELFCVVWGEEGPTYCEPRCNPLLQDCEPDEACHYDVYDFRCSPLTEQLPSGAPCVYQQQCDAGQFCVPAVAIPNCEGDSCCSPFCELGQQDACADVPGTTCLPFYDGNAPAGFENIGLCAAQP